MRKLYMYILSHITGDIRDREIPEDKHANQSKVIPNLALKLDFYWSPFVDDQMKNLLKELKTSDTRPSRAARKKCSTHHL